MSANELLNFLLQTKLGMKKKQVSYCCLLLPIVKRRWEEAAVFEVESSESPTYGDC